MDRDEADEVLARAMAVYPWADMSEATLAAWRGLLQRSGLPQVACVEALDRLALRSKRLPAIAEVLDEAREVLRERRAAEQVLPAVASRTPDQERRAAVHRELIRACLAGEITADELTARVESMR